MTGKERSEAAQAPQTIVPIDRFCQYARIDAQGDEALIASLLSAAEMAIVDKTGKMAPSDGDDLYQVAIMMLAAHWYDNRTPTGAETRQIPYTMDMLLNHIAICSRYPEVPSYEPYKRP